MNGALSGVRVLDFSEYIAGPYAGVMLADMGAEVTKVEPPHGDFWRLTSSIAPYESRGFIGVNKGKRSVSIDLKRPEAADFIRRAAGYADVVLANYRAGVAERLGVDYRSLSAINPRLIYCENTGFGHVGPYADRAGYDLVTQAMTGIMAFEGAAVDAPRPVISFSPTDLAAGMFMAYAIASALYQREKTGRGQRIETNLFAAGIAIQYRPMFSVEALDREQRVGVLGLLEQVREGRLSYDEVMADRRAARANQQVSNPYYRVYQAHDGYFAIACLNNRLRRAACEVLGVEDPRVAGNEFEPKALSAEEALILSQYIEARFTTKRSDEWMALFDEKGVPCGPVRQPAELFADRHVRDNDLLVELDHPVVGKVRMANSPLRMSGADTGSRVASPALGQHTRDFLAELGYAEAEIDALERAAVVRCWRPTAAASAQP